MKERLEKLKEGTAEICRKSVSSGTNNKAPARAEREGNNVRGRLCWDFRGIDCGSLSKLQKLQNFEQRSDRWGLYF